MHIVLSTTSGVPMYEQIKNQVRSSVHAGDPPAGALLPSLRGLAAELRVSVITVTRAYNDLVAEGIVVNEHGRGFVVQAVDTAVASAALADRVDRAVAEVVAAARVARMDLTQITEKVEEEWNER
ncbi:GntR family transcriptional regulator [Curtobacterium sp. 9128]|uniref:GntR family transcriptional regulator n=1 Tax=Curtobacterium sp. 9128 TaxID=1793722 RepID=UPI0011A4D855|nr:GntR family transcriptional regulator [Curtobacterium sp. 9128]